MYEQSWWKRRDQAGSQIIRNQLGISSDFGSILIPFVCFGKVPRFSATRIEEESAVRVPNRFAYENQRSIISRNDLFIGNIVPALGNSIAYALNVNCRIFRRHVVEISSKAPSLCFLEKINFVSGRHDRFKRKVFDSSRALRRKKSAKTEA